MIKGKLKKVILIATLTTILGSGLTGCGDKGKENKVEASNSKNYTEIGTYPVVKEPVTVEVYAPIRPGVNSYEYEKNSFTKYFTDKTGLEFEWLTSTESDRDTKKNAMLSSGTYPEVFLNCFFSNNETYLYGSQGIFIPLNDLIDKYAPNIKKTLEDFPKVKESLTSPDGNIYSLSTFGKSESACYPNKMWINRKWLDNLGLDMPTTTDEFYEVLKAFKEKDPNGNGIADEIPLSGSTNGWNSDPKLFLMNAFVPYTNGIYNYLYVRDGKIHKSQYEDGFKDGLSYMNKLYNEQLLDNLALSQTNDQLKKIVNNAGTPLVGCFAGGMQSVGIDVSTDLWRDYEAIPPLKGPKGQQNVAYFPEVGLNVFQITDKCKDPIAVIRAWDLLFSTEDYTAVLWNTTGELDVDYIKPEGEVTVAGKPALYRYLTKADEREGRTWNQMGPYRTAPDVWAVDLDNPGVTLYHDTMDKYMPCKPKEEDILPSFVFDEDASREIVNIEQPMTKYIDEQVAAFITGQLDIESEWDKYIKQLDGMGIKKCLDIYQKAYDEKVKK